MKKFKVETLVFVITVVLCACSPENATSPEQSVYLRIQQFQDVLADTIQVQPAVRFQSNYFILGIYNLDPQSKKAQEWGQHCMGLFEVGKIQSNWKIYGSPYSCSSNPNRDVFSTSIGVGLTTHAIGNEKYSYVAVETVIADAEWVDITWEDGLTQRVPVINDYFLALRVGAYYPTLFVVLDKDGKETYTSEFEPPS